MMSSYRSGIMTEKFLNCSSTRNEVNHGIVIVGYGTNKGEERIYGNETCEDYFIIRNSWGSQWGEKGFFKLCADGLGSSKTPLGTCLLNKYATWPTMDIKDVRPGE
jgi:hypothetical protein